MEDCKKCGDELVCGFEMVVFCKKCASKLLEAAPSASNNSQSDAIALQCRISEIILGKYLSDERKASELSAEIVAVVAQQHT